MKLRLLSLIAFIALMGVSPIQHVIVIVQENRSFDNLFQGFPGTNTQSYGLNSSNQQVPLQSVDITARYDISHTHPSFLTEYNNGQINGWNNAQIVDCGASCAGYTVYGYVPRAEVQPYWDLATQYTIADDMFQTSEGPSWPAHQYIISGTSTISNGSALRASENPSPLVGGCDSPHSLVAVINDLGQENQTAGTCYNRLSIMDLLDTAGVSWKYYQAMKGPGIWNAVDAIKQIWQKPEFQTNVVRPPSQVLTDIAYGALASVSFVTPTAAASDHAGETDGTGPSWVASIVNAVGGSQYWNDTAIFVVWDDWGGWYDHVKPIRANTYERGFRVPLLVISPYAKAGYVSHTPHEFGSILKFIEEQYGLPSLNTTDVRSDDFSDCFSFGGYAARRTFTPIKAKYGAQYFLQLPPSKVSPDND